MVDIFSHQPYESIGAQIGVRLSFRYGHLAFHQALILFKPRFDDSLHLIRKSYSSEASRLLRYGHRL